MSIAASGDNRDGLALFWAERFWVTHTNTEKRLIFVVADGFPAHSYDKYYPPVSSKDTAKAALKIIKRGSNIIAVALDDGKDNEYACHDALNVPN